MFGEMSQIVGEASGGPVESEILLCFEKQRLLEAFTKAVHEIMLLQQQQVTDIVNDDDLGVPTLRRHTTGRKSMTYIL